MMGRKGRWRGSDGYVLLFVVALSVWDLEMEMASSGYGHCRKKSGGGESYMPCVNSYGCNNINITKLMLLC